MIRVCNYIYLRVKRSRFNLGLNMLFRAFLNLAFHSGAQTNSNFQKPKKAKKTLPASLQIFSLQFNSPPNH